jgi:hypothetical protein
MEPLAAETDNPAVIASAATAGLARREEDAGTGSPNLIPALLALATNPVVPEAEQEAARVRALKLGAPLAPPPELLVDIGVSSGARWPQTANARSPAWRNARMLESLLLSLDAAGHGATRPAMLVRTRLGAAFDGMDRRSAARALFEQVAGEPETLLPRSDPIRVEALMRLSNLPAASRDLDAAAQALDATGLAPEQCATVETRPRPASMSVRLQDYPPNALNWGGSGFVRVAHDILPDGQAANPRAIVAIPPLLFSDASAWAAGRWRYEPVFRPGNPVGCAGASQYIRWITGTN